MATDDDSCGVPPKSNISLHLACVMKSTKRSRTELSLTAEATGADLLKSETPGKMLACYRRNGN